MSQEKIESLIQLFVETVQTHHTHQVEDLEGEYNTDWAAWYAEYLLENGINQLLDIPYDQNTLTQFLIAADTEYKSSAQEEKWPRFYARKIMA